MLAVPVVCLCFLIVENTAAVSLNCITVVVNPNLTRFYSCNISDSCICFNCFKESVSSSLYTFLNIKIYIAYCVESSLDFLFSNFVCCVSNSLLCNSDCALKSRNINCYVCFCLCVKLTACDCIAVAAYGEYLNCYISCVSACKGSCAVVSATAPLALPAKVKPFASLAISVSVKSPSTALV